MSGNESDLGRAASIITAAIGYCELSLWQDAWDELETLEPEERARPDVLRIRLGIYIALERYESAAILAESMVAKGDDSPSTWLHGAYAIRRTHCIEDARAFLLRGE